MDLQINDFDRILFFEHARKSAEAAYTKNPLDTDNLTRWAGVLLELSQFQNALESRRMTQDAISKLEEALLIDPKKHDALWCLGNIYIARAFLIPDVAGEVKDCFDKALQYFQQALKQDPGNHLYQKSLESAAKAPRVLQFQKQAAEAAAGPSTTFGAKNTKKNKNSDLKYDICGWIILAVGIAAWYGYARSHPPPPPPPF